MYPITMTFSVANEQQLAALVAATNGGGTMPAISPCQGHAVETAKAEAKKPEKQAAAPKEEKAAATQAIAGASAAPEQKVENSNVQQASGDDKAYTIDDAKSLTMKIVSAKGRDAAVDLLGKFGVPVAAKLAADQVNGFCAAAERVLAS